MKTPSIASPCSSGAERPLPDAVSGIATEDFIKSRIFTIRGVQVMLDRDLALLYGVRTKALNQAVKRNHARFPEEFSFLLSKDEQAGLVTNCDRFASVKHSSVPMRAFSEHGVIMLASILKSDIAAATSVRITRAFVAMRKALASIAPLLNRIDAVERRQITDQSRNEERFDTIFNAMDGGDFPPQKVFSTANTTTPSPSPANSSAGPRKASSSSTPIATTRPSTSSPGSAAPPP